MRCLGFFKHLIFLTFLAAFVLGSLQVTAESFDHECDDIVLRRVQTMQQSDVDSFHQYVHQQTEKMNKVAGLQLRQLLQIFSTHYEASRQKAFNSLNDYANFIALSTAMTVISSAFDSEGILAADVGFNNSPRHLISALSEDLAETVNELTPHNRESTEFFAQHLHQYLQSLSYDEVNFLLRALGLHSFNNQNQMRLFLMSRAEIEAGMSSIVAKFRAGYWIRPTFKPSPIEELNLSILENNWPVVLLDGQVTMNGDGYSDIAAGDAAKHDLIAHFLRARHLISPQLRRAALKALDRFEDPLDKKIVHLIYYGTLHEQRRLPFESFAAMLLHHRPLSEDEIYRLLNGRILRDITEPNYLVGYLSPAYYKSNLRRVLKELTTHH